MDVTTHHGNCTTAFSEQLVIAADLPTAAAHAEGWPEIHQEIRPVLKISRAYAKNHDGRHTYWRQGDSDRCLVDASDEITTSAWAQSGREESIQELLTAAGRALEGKLTQRVKVGA